MTTAPKLIREQLLADLERVLALKVQADDDEDSESVGATGIDAAYAALQFVVDHRDDIRSLAAEPVGGEALVSSNMEVFSAENLTRPGFLTITDTTGGSHRFVRVVDDEKRIIAGAMLLAPYVEGDAAAEQLAIDVWAAMAATGVEPVEVHGMARKLRRAAENILDKTPSDLTGLLNEAATCVEIQFSATNAMRQAIKDLQAESAAQPDSAEGDPQNFVSKWSETIRKMPMRGQLRATDDGKGGGLEGWQKVIDGGVCSSSMRVVCYVKFDEPTNIYAATPPKSPGVGDPKVLANRLKQWMHDNRAEAEEVLWDDDYLEMVNYALGGEK